MNEHLDEKDVLARVLRDRADDVSGHPVSFHAVRGSARRLQHRRRIVTGVVAAAVATISLPTGLAVNHALQGPDGGPDTEPQFAATPTAEPTPSGRPAPTPRADGTFALTITGLPRGADTTVRHVLGEGPALVGPEGRLELDTAYSQMTPYGDGWLALAGTEKGWENVVLTADLEVERRTLGGEAIMPDTEGTRVLSVLRDVDGSGRTVVVDEPTGSSYDRKRATWDVPADAAEVRPVGYADEDTVVFSTRTEEGESRTYLATAGDPALVPLEGFLDVSAVSEATGLVAGQVTYDPERGSCWAVMDPARSTTEMLFETCDHSLGEFSPDGHYVVASSPDADGQGPTGLAVLDVDTLEPVVELTPDRRTVTALTQATWEDSDTVVAVVMEGNDYALVRAELDGTLEAVSDTYTSADLSVPLWLAERPR